MVSATHGPAQQILVGAPKYAFVSHQVVCIAPSRWCSMFLLHTAPLGGSGPPDPAAPPRCPRPEVPARSALAVLRLSAIGARRTEPATGLRDSNASGRDERGETGLTTNGAIGRDERSFFASGPTRTSWALCVPCHDSSWSPKTCGAWDLQTAFS